MKGMEGGVKFENYLLLKGRGRGRRKDWECCGYGLVFCLDGLVLINFFLFALVLVFNGEESGRGRRKD
jgi:hypothetical protein